MLLWAIIVQNYNFKKAVDRWIDVTIISQHILDEFKEYTKLMKDNIMKHKILCVQSYQLSD